jgi:hypothetical protein
VRIALEAGPAGGSTAAILVDDSKPTIEDNPVPDDRTLLGHFLHDAILTRLHGGNLE